MALGRIALASIKGIKREIEKEIAGVMSISLTDAVTNGLLSLTAYGGTEQNGTPTPTTPIDIISNNGVLKFSKNMANVNAQTALVGYYISAAGVVTESLQNWIYQDYIPVEPNTTYTLSMSSPIYFVSISEYSTANDSGFIVRNASGSGARTQYTITTGANTHFVRFGANINGSSSVTLEIVLAIDWQLEIGDTPTPYHEYVEGGIYVDGTTETINIHGKNLYNKANGVLYGYPTGNYTWKQKASDTAELSIMVQLKEGNTYTVTRAEGAVSTFRIQASATSTLTDGQTLVDIDSTGAYTVTTKTFTVPQGTPYVLFYVRNTSSQSSLTVDDVINAFQVEQGSTATEYEPYFDGGTATAEMLLKVGDYTDEQEILSGNIIRKVGVQVLDGTENWKSAVTGKFYIDNYYMRNYNSMSTLCTHYEAVLASTTSQVGFGKIGLFATATQGQSSARLVIGDNNYTSVDDFKAYLSQQYQAGTPIIVLYPLIEQTTETVAGQTMNIPSGNSTIEITQASLNTLELSAKYKALPN